MKQLEKLKGKKTSLAAEKKSAAERAAAASVTAIGKTNKKVKVKHQKAVKQEKEIKEQAAKIKAQIEEIGEKLLADLVKVITRKGNLNGTVKSMNAGEAC